MRPLNSYLLCWAFEKNNPHLVTELSVYWKPISPEPLLLLLQINMALETHKEVFDDVRKQLVKQGDMFLGISSQLLHQHERLLEQQQRDLQQQLQFHELEVQWVLQQQAWLVTRRHAQQMNQISHILDDLQDMQGVQQQVLQQQERVLHASMRLPLQEDVAINVIKQHADYHVAEEKLRSMQKEASQKLEQFVQCMEGSYPRDAVIALAKPAPLSLQQQADSARAWLQRARQQEIMLQEQLALKSRPSEYANLQSYLASHYPSLSSVTLCHNSLTQTAQLNQQLKLLNLLPNLRSLQLLDAVRWRIPVSLAGLSQLTNLTRLSLLIQSPGSHFGDGVYGVPDAWQVRWSHFLTCVTYALLTGSARITFAPRVSHTCILCLLTFLEQL